MLQKTKETQINLLKEKGPNDDDDQLHHNEEDYCDDGVHQNN